MIKQEGLLLYASFLCLYAVRGGDIVTIVIGNG